MIEKLRIYRGSILEEAMPENTNPDELAVNYALHLDYPTCPGGGGRLASGASWRYTKMESLFMTTAVQAAKEVSLADYLSMALDGPSPEFIDGSILRRSEPMLEHSNTQTLIAQAFGDLRRRSSVFPYVELRLQLDPRRVRVPDVCLFAQKPTERMPTAPPLVAAEVVSPSDHFTAVREKLAEYRNWGVKHVWLADPETSTIAVCDEAGLHEVTAFHLPEFDFILKPADIF